MTKTIQIRDLDDDVYAGLAARAGADGITVPELLRREATRLARTPSIEAWLVATLRARSSVDRTEVVSTLDELRGPWHS